MRDFYFRCLAIAFQVRVGFFFLRFHVKASLRYLDKEVRSQVLDAECFQENIGVERKIICFPTNEDS